MENNQLATKESFESNNFCSFKAESLEDKKKLFQASSKCDIVINDIVGQEIALKDILITSYQKPDEKGIVKERYRSVIFDADGKSYITCSTYFRNALVKLMVLFGTPNTWGEPMNIRIIKTETKNGKALGFELV